MRIIGILILAAFYAVYFGKLLLQRRRGIRTDQLGTGRRDQAYYTELLLKLATCAVVPAELICILAVEPALPAGVRAAGAALAALGTAVFAAAVVTMRDSWRAGLAREDTTALVTGGVYQISRNPAFLGFDCVYLGLLLMFFHWALLIFTAFAVVMLHLQILQEERYLPAAFGQAYPDYQSAVCRYIGRKRPRPGAGQAGREGTTHE